MKKKIIGTKHEKMHFKRIGGENICWLYWQIVFNKMKRQYASNDHAISTVRILTIFWKKFFNFIKLKNITHIRDLTKQNVIEYVTFISNLSISTICVQISFFKHFLKYLYLNRFHEIDLTYSIPKVRHSKNKNIPHTVWSKEEINNILNSIDTTTSIGKRDYSILTIISHLGLRISDVLDLKFINIDWKNNTISINQRKTKKLVILPLTNEVGISLINYIKYARPNVNSPYIFLSTHTPYNRLNYFNNFNPRFRKYLSLANIDISNKRLVGVHSLRHSISSILLQNNTPLSTISPILGHSNINSTDIYLKIDIEHLRECCLSLEVLK